jgi:hypothetical protein
MFLRFVFLVFESRRHLPGTQADISSLAECRDRVITSWRGEALWHYV